MVEHFYTILKEENAELVEKKSKFIAEIYNVSDKNEAENIIKAVKKKYYDAKHHCIAYRIMDNGMITEKSSDDGEPSGTAGAPMLNLLQGRELCNVVVIVTRYFGGILLGTGGLVRAYTDVTRMAIEKCQLVCKVPGKTAEVELEYSSLENFKYYCKNNDINIIQIEYFENIKLIIEMEISKEEKLVNDIENKKISVISFVELAGKMINKGINN